MEIIGNGFIARNLAVIADRYPHATVVAAGVSSTSGGTPEDFAREAELVRDIARRCRREGRLLVYLSSASHALYGITEVAVAEDAPVDPPSPYGRQKLMLERAIAEAGPGWLVLRLSHAAGRWQRSHQLLPSLIGQIRGGNVTLHRGAHRDLVDVSDVVRAIDGLLTEGVQDEVVNVASSVPQPVESIVRGIERRMAARARYDVVDVTPTLTRVSIDKLCKLLPSMRSVAEAGYLDRILDRYVAYY
ncbi:NAD-dependent epimerase/dehydratase family protein [Streptomyces sp. ME19-01-6]|uniref:NAD-dependent epimerase/dehydratase family protein n=1 Tax=Streptomyces sp. ME19-01-6 TaxID=3028686 RepID=UPI0029BBEEB0|nr:NAD-dependent epimerase/dehydratase family protein [Streptomyces sp. ME19-01-6]MDX3232330.1 NAD-dependent epimerase/dehydratase family protein [Streptomyces sp. ME19-01-6]